MTSSAQPRVFVNEGVAAFAAPDIEAWVRTTLVGGERLYEAAMQQAVAVLEGRGPVPVVGTKLGRWVVRRYRRGGRVAAPLLGERYLRVGVERPLREAEANAEARRRGIPTPRVVAGAVYCNGPFYRADLITEFVAGASDLAHTLFQAEYSDSERAEILRVVGTLIAKSAAAGIEHCDLNAKNVLVGHSLHGPVPLLLDLDRCRVLPPGVAGDPTPMLERLVRSLRKHSELTHRPIGFCDLRILSESAMPGDRG